MKTPLTLTAALIGGILLPAAGYGDVAFVAVGDATENITGCATVPVEGSNYTVRADVTCALAENQDGDNTIVIAAIAEVIEDLAEEAAEEAAE